MAPWQSRYSVGAGKAVTRWGLVKPLLARDLALQWVGAGGIKTEGGPGKAVTRWTLVKPLLGVASKPQLRRHIEIRRFRLPTLTRVTPQHRLGIRHFRPGQFHRRHAQADARPF